MGFKCGIVGLPNVGKSTLFNALTASKNAEAANFPFCTIDPNIGIILRHRWGHRPRNFSVFVPGFGYRSNFQTSPGPLSKPQPSR